MSFANYDEEKRGKTARKIAQNIGEDLVADWFSGNKDEKDKIKRLLGIKENITLVLGAKANVRIVAEEGGKPYDC